MPLYKYCCENCDREVSIHKAMKDYQSAEYCECGERMVRIIGCPAVLGTADSFGIGKGFYGKDGKFIDNWKTWEKAGYTDEKSINDSYIKDGVKEKIEKITKYDSGKKFSVKT